MRQDENDRNEEYHIILFLTLSSQEENNVGGANKKSGGDNFKYEDTFHDHEDDNTHNSASHQDGIDAMLVHTSTPASGYTPSAFKTFNSNYETNRDMVKYIDSIVIENRTNGKYSK